MIAASLRAASCAIGAGVCEMFAAYEHAILERLDAVFGIAATRPLAYKVLTIESYGGQIALDEQGRPVAMQSIRLPALFVTLGEAKVDKALGERASSYKMDVTVYCCAYNNRNEAATRHGDANEVGSYQLSWDVARMMANQRFGSRTFKALRLKSFAPLFSAAKVDSKAISVRAVTFETQFVFNADLPDCVWIGCEPPQEVEAVYKLVCAGFFLPKSPQEQEQAEAGESLLEAAPRVSITP